MRLGPSWACAFATALPVVPSAIADGAGGVYLAAPSSTALDLGCGALPAAPGGSLFVTRLDGAGHCLWGRAFVAPALALNAAPGGRLVLSAAAGSGPVDLGAGALPPLGAADEVLAELGPDGATLWSRRLGAPGVTFQQPVASVSAAGDVYLLTGASGPVDLGGGPLPGGATLVASYTPAGAHRWSRTFAVGGQYTAPVDGCGALVLTSADRAFDPGCGPVIPDSAFGSYLPYCPYFWPYPNGAVARFQP